MSLHTRISRLALGWLLFVSTISTGFALRKAPESFTPFVPRCLPQRALGDFDGDGRVDTAQIQDLTGDRRISIQLSGSPDAVHLEAPVIGVIEGDIDHDGDLDLVAATPSGDVLIWLNDGHGRFKRQPAARSQGLSSASIIVQMVWPESMAPGNRAPLVPPPARTEAVIIVTPNRPPTALVHFDVRFRILPALRAPPAFAL
jgi:VCBS repeat protein